MAQRALVGLDVTVSGPFFDRDRRKEVEGAIEEGIEKLGKRSERGGKGLGARRNRISREKFRNPQTRFTELGEDVFSTRLSPRTTGRAWTNKNLRIWRAMAPRVFKSVLNRVIARLN